LRTGWRGEGSDLARRCLEKMEEKVDKGEGTIVESWRECNILKKEVGGGKFEMRGER